MHLFNEVRSAVRYWRTTNHSLHSCLVILVTEHRPRLRKILTQRAVSTMIEDARKDYGAFPDAENEVQELRKRLVVDGQTQQPPISAVLSN